MTPFPITFRGYEKLPKAIWATRSEAFYPLLYDVLRKGTLLPPY